MKRRQLEEGAWGIYSLNIGNVRDYPDPTSDHFGPKLLHPSAVQGGTLQSCMPLGGEVGAPICGCWGPTGRRSSISEHSLGLCFERQRIRFPEWSAG